MTNEKICPICEGEDEKYADGLWDLAGTICEDIQNYDYDLQDIIYYTLTAFVERKGYCPNCGKRINKLK